MGLRFRQSPEFDLIARYFSRHQSNAVELSVGDDAAVFSLPENHCLVFSIDTQVEGRHFPVGFPADKIATRALGSAMSDLAAMGARPHHFTLALTLPEFEEQWLHAFSRGLYELADRFDFKLVGGDTTKGPLSISIQVHGLVERDRYLQRSTASSADGIYVSGSLGDAAGGLKLALSNRQDALSDDEHRLFNAYACPRPEVELGLALVGNASAALDISDGLLADLEQLAVASDLACHLDLDTIPLSGALRRVEGDVEALNLALAGGDDYRLLATMPANKERLAKELGLFKIGYMLDCPIEHTGERVRLYKNGVYHRAPNVKGFDHFG
jgi:thiamine-monophosphate kinase